MISTIVANLYGVLRPLLLVATVLFAVVGWWLLRRGQSGRRVLGVLALISVAVALVLALTPDTAASAPQFCAVQAQIFTAGSLDLPNVMLLLPAALFTALWSRRLLPVFAAATGLSALIEVTQGALPLGRSCDTDDLIANTIGAGIGVLLAVVVSLLQRRRPRTDEERRDRPAHQGQTTPSEY